MELIRTVVVFWQPYPLACLWGSVAEFSNHQICVRILQVGKHFRGCSVPPPGIPGSVVCWTNVRETHPDGLENFVAEDVLGCVLSSRLGASSATGTGTVGTVQEILELCKGATPFPP